MKILPIGDTHFPFTDYDKLNRIADKVDYVQPDVILQMGDLYDLYSWSRYPGTPNIMTPAEELAEGRQNAEAFWELMKLVAPKARLIQLLGNHDDRIMRTVSAKAPELEAVMKALDIMSLWRFKGVETQTSSRDEIMIEHPVHGAICFMHGHRGRLGAHMNFNQMNTVCGHSHHGGVVFQRLREKSIWELNVGYLADQKAKVMQYTMQSLSSSVPGYGVIDNDGPRFNPL